MEIRAMLITLLVAGGLITGVFLVYSSFVVNYSISGVSNITFTKANETLALVSDAEAPIKAPQQTTDLGAFLLSIPSGAIEALRMMFSSIDLMRTLVAELFANFIGVQLAKWFVDILTGVVVVIVTFEVASALLKYKL